METDTDHHDETRSEETELIIMMIMSDHHVRLSHLLLRLGHFSEAWSAQGQSAFIIIMSQTLT